MHHKLFCLVGPSGVGKDTIKKEIFLPHVISYRTRPKRNGEIDGVDGYFISKEEFIERDQRNEWVAKTEYDGHFYGITKEQLKTLYDAPMIYVIDWDGVITLKESFKKSHEWNPDKIVSIFIYAPIESLKQRMVLQGRDPDTIQRRLNQAKKDYEAAKYCDYIVENKDGQLDKTVKDIYKIVIQELLK
jgi:guanylate kinase